MTGANQPSIRTLIVERNDIARNGLAHVLHADPRFIVARAVRGVHDAQSDRLQPDLIVVDPTVSRCIQPDILAELAVAAPNAYICIRTSAIDQGAALNVMHDHRVNAYILKSGHVGEHLLDVLHVAVHTGGAFIDAALMERFRADADGRLTLQCALPSDCLLSTQQLQILCLLAEGQTSKEIAARLNMTESTVGSHLGRARDKLGARTNEQLVRIAMQSGLLL